ncbi:MAG: transcription-repair coupling factor [Planctomycetes bacterium]|nr:transcription-repair coupling factor [Planctomycetota bacterium]
MDDILRELAELPALAAAERILAAHPLCEIGGLWGSAHALVAAALARRRGTPLLFVTPAVEEADEAVDDLRAALGDAVRPFPAWESLPDDTGPPDPRIFADRLNCLLDCAGAAPLARSRIIVAPAIALLQPVPAPERLANRPLDLAVGAEIDRDELTALLVEHELAASPTVDVPGEFSVRGGILDFFPYAAPRPLRLEFFGDHIDSIRTFDPETQTSDATLATVRVPLVRKSLFFAPAPSPAAGAPGAGPGAAPATLLDYLPRDAVVVLKEPAEALARVTRLLAAEGGREGAWEGATDAADAATDLRARLGRFRRVETRSLPVVEGDVALNLTSLSTERFSGDLASIFGELRTLLAASRRVVILCPNPAEEERLRDLLREEKLAGDARLQARQGRLAHGFSLPELGLAILPHHELFHRYRLRRVARKLKESRPLDAFLDLETGDYVVHTTHGIGRYCGMETREEHGEPQEFVVLEYSGAARLYVPITAIDLVHKYVGGDEKPPDLSRLGGSSWRDKKAKATEAVAELAVEFLEIQAVREQEMGISYPKDGPWQREFEASFEFEDTEDQIAATDAIRGDMESARPMDRLLCGDVGYGKTEVAVRAAFKAAIAGKQVAILVPTTVLAEQHGQTFRERMAEYPVTVEVLSRFRSSGEAGGVIKRLGRGEVDIVIGTHKLLGREVKFKDLGLVVIDEEQRFGVEHKERLKKLRATVDVLTLTATPIPRTLHMALLGIRDISTLNTPPADRRAVATRVCRYDKGQIRGAVLRELQRDGQVYFVHNRVYDIEEVESGLRALVPEARFSVVHGQMDEHLLAQRMRDFLERRSDVLVTTTIIESGLDIPSVNTLFVDEADHFGLADLHQLRGRVGRYTHQAYAYFLLPPDRPVTPDAAKRLKALEEFNELGAGFKIAMRDLEIRGAGNLLGKEQSGHIAAVGYDLYCKLLDSAVKKAKKQPVPRELETRVDLKLEARVPESYAPTERQRVEIYRKLCRAASPEDVAAIGAELADRYGPAPAPVRRLLEMTEVRVLAEAWELASLAQGDGAVVGRYANRGKVEALKKRHPGLVRIVDAQQVNVVLGKRDAATPERTLALLKRVLAVPG